MRLLITGASGFLGSALLNDLQGIFPLRAVLRQEGASKVLPSGIETVKASLSGNQDWSKALFGISAIVHCGARVHVMNDQAQDPLAEFRLVNVEGTLQLATQAAQAGVKRFIFISSIKVNGESTVLNHPYTADNPPAPQDPYGISKMEAEDGLRELSSRTGMEVVIIRPPLIYGSGVRANFASMMRSLKQGIPLPFGGVTNNRRSLVYIGNLIDLIRVCIDHPKAANQTFLVSDDEDVSTSTLLQRLANVLGKPARLVNLSPEIIKLAAKFIGKSVVADRLCGSLQVDITKTKQLLDWKPKFSLDEGLVETVIGYK